MDVKVISKTLNYPVVKDGKQVCYLLLHVCIPSNIRPTPSINYLQGVESAKLAGNEIGVKVWPVQVAWVKNSGDYQCFFRFPRYGRNDKRAQQIGECFLHALALTYGPFLPPDESTSVLRVPAAVVRHRERVSGDELVQIEELREYTDRTLTFPATSLGTLFGTSKHYFEAAWKITPLLLKNENLFRATRFLKASQDDFFVWPGGIHEVLETPDAIANSSFEQMRLETALQNAFKAVEAILGDPPKDDAKFIAKIRAAGLDPDERVDYSEKIPIYTIIRQMNEVRDKRVAHGSTAHRSITLVEVLEYQACSQLVVWTAIESKLGRPIFET